VEAATELLVQQGCRELTMDAVAARAGVAKGSLYLHANNRDGLVGEVLDRWSSEVAPEPGASGDPRERAAGVWDALFVGVARGGREGVPVFPCCLHGSPCPHGWGERWRAMLAARGIEASDAAMPVGEVAQALASTDWLRGRAAPGRLDEARSVVRQAVDGFMREGRLDAT
jgi:AcrR family transcriptional regulator